jgi:hypothetical protein
MVPKLAHLRKPFPVAILQQAYAIEKAHPNNGFSL